MLICPHCNQRGIPEMSFLTSHLYGFAACEHCAAVVEQRWERNSPALLATVSLGSLLPVMAKEFALAGATRLALCAALLAIGLLVARRMVQWKVLQPGRPLAD